MQYTKPAFRNAAFYCHVFSRSLTLNPNPLLLVSPFRKPETFRLASPVSCLSSSSMAVPPSSLEKQFDDFRVQLEESGTLRERIRSVVSEIESSTRLIYATLLLVHQSRPTPELLEKAKSHVNVLKKQYKQLAEVVGGCPGQYYRYHGDWKSETQSVVSMLTFMHWLETGSLLEHKEAEEKLGLNSSEFGLDVEDYLIGESSKHASFLQEVLTNLNMIVILKNMGVAVRISRVSKAKELNNQMRYVILVLPFKLMLIHFYHAGVCFMSNELPRYVVNQVTAGDYDCPRKVLKFLTDLHAAFRMLNLRNDFLRKKFDGMKYDLRKVEEVYYDVKIRGLTPNGEPVGDLEIKESQDNLNLKL
ncbi:hypothetical protein JHK84_053871 [Glycine max]|uniref:Translin isoform B n=1 Tax=Glycine soja TaxID=3848 RepID=A0A445FIA1_GLYSO|nr:hypothetical protein JHK86_053842 [Glycine max]KAG4928312.1 hypothetical protein JHK85_054798 [Glycine max]KAG5083833.1 hypothetical protein JHK84_053871 [Glycine max]KAH1195248.1 Translin [Glycine max]RZB48550.1 Translin isoform B [Glycine soja]